MQCASRATHLDNLLMDESYPSSKKELIPSAQDELIKEDISYFCLQTMCGRWE
jgi:hypothetical protein